MSSNGQFEGKVAVVTGGARGIGLKCVEQLLERGASVIVADVDAVAGRASLNAQRASDGRVEFVSHDAADASSGRRCIDAAVERFGGVDVVVNCAGIATAARPKDPHGDLPDIAPALNALLQMEAGEWQRVLDVNLTGSFAITQAAVEHMIRSQRSGSIVLIASTAAANPAMASDFAYGPSKAGVCALTKHVASVVARHGIRINAVGPGVTDTSMSQGLQSNPEAMTRVLGQIPIGRLAAPDEIARTVVFLASDEASYITGEVLFVDGGYFTG
ncbi:MAG: SDR family NAD(P)-dependent oxidoreductase [Acidimicrobiia bacterium]